MSIKDFTAGYIFKLVEANDKMKKTLLSKANSILVEIIKKEWNGTWKSAIKDIVQSSYQSQDICENNLLILKELSQDIFDFSKNSIVKAEVVQLKTNFGNEFMAVYEVCDFVTKSFLKDSSQVKGSLIKACLETMQSFLSWMPSFYILMTDLIENVLVNFLSHKRYLLTTLKCFEEIFNLDVQGEGEQLEKAKSKMVFGFGLFLEKIATHYNTNKNFENERQVLISMKNLKELNFFEMFCQNYAMTLHAFYSNHLQWVEEFAIRNEKLGTIIEYLEIGLQYMGILTEVSNSAILKTCCDFWYFYTNYYTTVIKKNRESHMNQALNLGQSNIDVIQNKLIDSNGSHQGMFNLVTQTPKPLEVLIIIDDDGIPRTETVSNTASSSMYELVKKIFINYTIINWTSLKKIFNYKLDQMMASKGFEYEKLNSLCWSCGCIADTLKIEEERTFYIKIVRMLLQFVSQSTHINDKAIIASNIMHIVSQYKRFLEMNDDYLKTVIKKLFEFVHEKFEGVKEMACNTFLKVCQQVKHQLIAFNDIDENGKEIPYISNIIRNINKHTEDLGILQKIQFFESAATIISACPDNAAKSQLVFELMTSIDHHWFEIIKQLNNFDFISNIDRATDICFFLKVNERVCFAVGQSYSNYFNHSMSEIQNIYKQYSNLIMNDLQNNGENGLKLLTVRKYRAVRKDILHLLSTFVSVTEDNKFFIHSYSSLLIMTLENYNSDIPEIREAEVLEFLSKSIEILQGDIINEISELIPHILNSVLPMITKDFSSFPEHRANFFVLVQTMVKNCFQVFFQIPPDTFKTIIDCVIWAIKHELPNIYEIGLDTLNCILENVSKQPQFAEDFFKFYYISILNDILFVLLDGLHTNGFNKQCKTLYILIKRLNQQQSQIFDEKDNKIAAFNHMLKLMSENFPNLASSDHNRLIKEIFESSVKAEKDFRASLRDYLISLNLYTKSD